MACPSGSDVTARSPGRQGGMAAARGSSCSGAGLEPNGRINAARGSSGGGDIGSQGSVNIITKLQKAGALSTYDAMKSGGGQGAPPPPLVATSTVSPNPGVHRSTLEYMFGSKKATALNTYVLMKYGSERVNN